MKPMLAAILLLLGVLQGWCDTNSPADSDHRQKELASLLVEIARARERLAELVPAPQTWKEIASWKVDGVTRLAVGKNGESVVVTAEKKGVRIYEPGRSEPRTVFDGETCGNMRMSPDGAKVAVLREYKVCVLRLPDGAALHGPAEIAYPPQPTYRWCPDSEALAGTRDWGLAFWRPPNEPKPAEQRHGQDIMAIAIRSDGSQIASLCKYGHVKRYTAEGQVLGDTEIPAKRGADLCYVADGKLLAVAGEEDWAINLLDAANGAEVAALRAHAAPVICLAPVGDGARLLSIDRDGESRLWDTAKRSCIDVARCHDGWFASPATPFRRWEQISDDTRVAAYPTAGLVLFDHPFGTVLLDMATLQPVAFLPNADQYYSPGQSALDGTGRFLATTGSQPGLVVLWKRVEEKPQ